MEKKYALFFALAITAIIAINYWYFTSYENGKPANIESVIVGRVVDGDTFDLSDGRRIRMLNINTPEKGEFGSDGAIAYTKQLENRTVDIEIIGRETYGRLLARVYSPDYMNLEMVRQGFARTLLVQENEVSIFAEAEDEAFEASRGVWERSEEYECLTGEIDKKDEYVIFDKRCDVSLVGWTISDETTRKYTIKQDPAEHFVFYSAEGRENRTALYWKRGNAWNDDRDALIVRDETGKLVYYTDYGY
jgi:endonuclease YncB( thermonuclease family)